MMAMMQQWCITNGNDEMVTAAMVQQQW